MAPHETTWHQRSATRGGWIVRTITIAGALAAVSSQTLAQEEAQDGRHWTVGVAAAWSPSPYKDYDNQSWALPMVGYEGERVYFRGAALGYKLYKADADEISVSLGLLPLRYKASRSDDPAMRRLNDRNFSGMSGLNWNHREAWGMVSASVQWKVIGSGNGYMADLRYAYPWRVGRVMVVPTVGLRYWSASLNQTYYGISAKESSRSGLARYDTEDSLTAFGSLMASYQLTQSWSVMGMANIARLSATVRNSPMVDATTARGYTLGVNYRF